MSVPFSCSVNCSVNCGFILICRVPTLIFDFFAEITRPKDGEGKGVELLVVLEVFMYG